MVDDILTITAEVDAPRIDVFVTNTLKTLSRATVQRLLLEGEITLNGQPAKPREGVKIGDEIVINIPPPIAETEVKPEEIPLEIVYQDEFIAIINKPAGLIVHPGAGNWSGTLVNALLYEIKDLSGIGGVLRPGIVHRLDRDTSGLICVAKNDFAHQKLAKELESREMTRQYLTLSYGHFEEDEFTVDASIGRSRTNRKKMAVSTDDNTTKRAAKTDFTVLKRFSHCALLRAKLYTGRTHQIRVHLNYVGHPVLNDPVYGLSAQKQFLPFLSDEVRREIRGLKGQALHAAELALTHPKTGERMVFTAEMPQEMKKVIEKLEENNHEDFTT